MKKLSLALVLVLTVLPTFVDACGGGFFSRMRANRQARVMSRSSMNSYSSGMYGYSSGMYSSGTYSSGMEIYQQPVMPMPMILESEITAVETTKIDQAVKTVCEQTETSPVDQAVNQLLAVTSATDQLLVASK